MERHSNKPIFILQRNGHTTNLNLMSLLKCVYDIEQTTKQLNNFNITQAYKLVSCNSIYCFRSEQSRKSLKKCNNSIRKILFSIVSKYQAQLNHNQLNSYISIID